MLDITLVDVSLLLELIFVHSKGFQVVLQRVEDEGGLVLNYLLVC